MCPKLCLTEQSTRHTIIYCDELTGTQAYYGHTIACVRGRLYDVEFYLLHVGKYIQDNKYNIYLFCRCWRCRWISVSGVVGRFRAKF